MPLAVWIEMTQAEGPPERLLPRECWQAFHFKQCVVAGVLLCGNFVHRTASPGVVSECCGQGPFPSRSKAPRNKDWQAGPLRGQLRLRWRYTCWVLTVWLTLSHGLGPRQGKAAHKKDKQMIETLCFKLPVVYVLTGLETNRCLTLLGISLIHAMSHVTPGLGWYAALKPNSEITSTANNC